jgi:hypothetical protein
VLASEIKFVALRKRFMAASEEIAKDLSLLVGRVDEEPTEVRALQLAAAKEIAAAQVRLRLEADRLEGAPEQRVAILRAMLEAQQAAQQQLAVIIKRHRPSTLLRSNLEERLANMARQLEASVAASRLVDARLADVGHAQLSTTSRGADGEAPRNMAIAIEPRSRNGNTSSDLPPANNPKTAEVVPNLMRLGMIIKAGTSMALLVAVVSAGLVIVFFYVSLPGARPRQEATAEHPIHERRRSDPLPSHPPAVQGIPPEGRQPGVTAKPAAQPPVTPGLAAPSSALKDTKGFVPVVFTHKDKTTALRAFAELQRRYPSLLTHRQSELHSVDTGNNGIWYRLVVLPAGSHQEALETCGRLAAAGYDRCWVKPY